MGSYTDEPRRETLGDLIFRAVSGLATIAGGTWVGLSVYPELAISMGIVGVVAVLSITAWKARRLNTTCKQQ
jgi:hypothetical protein